MITGALVGGLEDTLSNGASQVNPFNGSFQITILDSLRFQYTMDKVPTAAPTGDMWVGKSSGRYIGIKSQPSITDPYNPGDQGASVSGTGPWTVTVITEKPHLRIPGENVALANVRVGGVPSDLLSDLFTVTERVNSRKLKFVISTNPGAPDAAQLGGALINSSSDGITAAGGIATVAENNRIYNTDNAFYHDSFATKDVVIRGNYCYGVIIGIFEHMGGGTQRVGSGLVRNGLVASFTTAQAHNLSTGSLTISGAVVANAYSPYFNGTFSSFTVINSTSFSYTMTSVPDTNAFGSPVFTVPPTAPFTGRVVRYASDKTKAFFTTDTAHGFVAGNYVSVFGASLSGSIVNPFNGVFQVLASPAPTSTTFYYQMSSDPGVDPAPAPPADNASCWVATACPLVSSGTTATFTTPLRHTLEVGQGIIVSGAGGAPYDGGFSIASVPTPETLKYEMGSAASGNALPTAQFKSLWQVGRIVVERNIIELVLKLLQSGVGLPNGMSIDGGANASPYVFRQVVVRGNLVRNLDNAVDTTPGAYRIALDGCENAIVEGNIMNIDSFPPMRHQSTCGQVKYFNNQTPGGQLVQGYLSAFLPPHYVNELATDINLAASLLT